MSDRGPVPPTARARRFPRALAIVLAAAVVLIGGAWVALAVMFPPARVRALVQAQLDRSLSRPTRFESASLSLWPPVRLTVVGPALAEPGGFAAGAALRARSIHLDLDLLGLLQRRLVVRRLEIVEPFVHLALARDGTSNFDHLVAPPAPGAAAAKGAGISLDLLIQELRLRDARLQLDDGPAHRRVVLALDTRLSFSSEAGGRRIGTAGEWKISQLAFGPDTVRRLAQLNRSFAGLTWKLEHRGGFDSASRRLSLDRLALDLGRSALVVSGVVDEPGPQASFDLKLHGERLDLAQLLEFLAAADLAAVRGVKGSGAARFDLAATGRAGPGRTPEVTGTLAVENASVRYPGAPVAIEGLSFGARFTPDAVEVPDLAARVAGQTLHARIEARHFADPALSFGVKGALDLAAIGPLVAPPDTRIGGHAQLDVSGSGRARDPGSLALQGRVVLSDVSAQSPALPHKIEGVAGTIVFSPARAEIQHLTARAGQSSFALEGSATRPLAVLAKAGAVAPAEVRFRFDSPYLDLMELLPPGPSKPTPFNARGGGDVAIGRLRNQKLDVRNVRAKVTLVPNRLEVPWFTFDGYGGAVTGNASFGIEDPARPSFKVKARADSIKASEFLSAWTSAGSALTGSMSGDFDLSGSGSEPKQVLQNLTAVGLAAVREGQLRGPALDAIAKLTGHDEFRDMRFKDLHLPFRVERGRVVTDPVQLAGPYGDWRLIGAIGFDGALDYAVSITLPREATAKLGSAAALAAAGLADAQGRTLIDLEVSGSARAPRIALNTRAMRDRLAGHADQAIAAQREKLAREALEKALGTKFSADSTGKPPSLASPQVQEEVRKKAGDLLQGLFGKKKTAPPAAPRPADSAAARAPAPPATPAAPVPDTTGH
jgi:hypothetical protein